MDRQIQRVDNAYCKYDYYTWRNEWADEYYECKIKKYKWRKEYYEWINEYYEYYNWSSKYYE